MSDRVLQPVLLLYQHSFLLVELDTSEKKKKGGQDLNNTDNNLPKEFSNA